MLLPRWQKHDKKVTSYDEGKQTNSGETQTHSRISQCEEMQTDGETPEAKEKEKQIGQKNKISHTKNKKQTIYNSRIFYIKENKRQINYNSKKQIMGK